jgi:predicted nucleotidyltransferase
MADQLAQSLATESSSIAFAYLYGSALDADAVHDVDVGLFLTGVLPDQGHTLAAALATKLSAVVGLPVDVRVLNDAPTPFLYHVLRGRLLLCRDELVLTTMLETVGRRYLDLEPLLRQGTRDAFAA